MKKLFLLMLTVFVFAACEGPAGPMGPEGPRGPEGEPGYGTNWNVEYFVVGQGDWEKMVDTKSGDVYFRCIRVPALYSKITEEQRYTIYDEGTVFAYVYNEYDTENETQTLLPYVINWNNSYFETLAEVFYFDYTPGDVAFYASFSGTDNSNYLPPGKVFRVVMNW